MYLHQHPVKQAFIEINWFSILWRSYIVDKPNNEVSMYFAKGEYYMDGENRLYRN